MARTKEFDETAVLSQAMRVFWDLGYDGASMADILAATGLSRSSLYETFTDKRTLFLRTVSAYAAKSGDRRQAAFSHPEGIRKGLSEYLQTRIEGFGNMDCPAGCYLTSLSGSLKTADDELRSIVTAYTVASEREIEEGFSRALGTKEISSQLSADEWTNLFLALSWGLNVAARMGRPRSMLDSMVSGFLAVLDT